MPDDPYSLADLARLVDVTPRTVRYYVAQGLLPSPEAAGPATRYGDGHLARLRLIKRLQRDHLPLAEIRVRLERMGDEEIQATLDVLDAVTPEPSTDPGDTLAYIQSLMRTSHVQPVVRGAPASATRSLLSSMKPASAPDLDLHPSAEGNEASQHMERAISAFAMAPVPAPAPTATPAPAFSPPLAPASTTPLAARPPALRRAYLDERSPSPSRSTWERVSLSPDVEIHVRQALGPLARKRVTRLLQLARELYEGEP